MIACILHTSLSILSASSSPHIITYIFVGALKIADEAFPSLVWYTPNTYIVSVNYVLLQGLVEGSVCLEPSCLWRNALAQTVM